MPTTATGAPQRMQAGGAATPPQAAAHATAHTVSEEDDAHAQITILEHRELLDQQLPLKLHNQVQGIVYEVARLYGFQTFNPGVVPKGSTKTPQYTPATAFVAADHLEALLLTGTMRLASDDTPSDKLTASQSRGCEEVFIKAVYQLHSKIFESYGIGWCTRVKLHQFPKALLELRYQVPALSTKACHMLLCELALYFLIWTEAVNGRHLPETLWFFYWCAAHTEAFMEICDNETIHVVNQAVDVRTHRIRCRNQYKDVIASSHEAVTHDPTKWLPRACFPVRREQLAQHAPSATPAARALSHYLQHQAGVPVEDLVVVTELALNGDGGFWLAHVVTPLFLLLAQEMEAMSNEDHYHRLGYDDVNESFCSRQVVHRALKYLGVTEQQIHDAATNVAFTAIAVWIGSPSGKAPMGEVFGASIPQQDVLKDVATACSTGKPVEDWFHAQRAAAFWSIQVAAKTFLETRTWLAVYRAYHRVFQINLVAFHIMMAQSLTSSWDWLPLSTAVLTHSGLQALERYANWVITRRSISRTMHSDLRRFGITRGWLSGRGQLPKSSSSDAEAADGDAINNFRAARLLRRPFSIEGAPVLGIFGFLEWVVVFCGLVTLFVMQRYAPDNWAHVVTRDQLHEAWAWAAAAYGGLVGLHFILTTRPGYCISLSHAFYLPSIFRASSCRPAAESWVSGSLSVNFGSWLRQVLTWSTIWAAKWAFEYFLVSKPLAREIHSLLEYNICDTTLNDSGMCIDISWLLVVVTMAPFVCLVLTDGMIMYHLYLTCFSLTASLLRLNFAALPEWSECVREFHRAPLRWWNKCMSASGRVAAESDTQFRYQELTSTASPATAYFTGHGTLRRTVNQGMAVDPKKTAQFEAFSSAWDALIADLREGDMLTDSEAKNCSFVRLHPEGRGWTAWPAASAHVGPVVMPAFFFAGQVQRVVDNRRVNTIQSAVLEQMRSLALLLAVDLGLLSRVQADEVQACLFLGTPASHEHVEARVKTLPAAIKLVNALRSICTGRSTVEEGAKAFTEALKHVLEGLEVECRASGGLTQKDVDRMSKQQHEQQPGKDQPQNKSSKQRAADALHVLRGLQLLVKSPAAVAENLWRLAPPTDKATQLSSSPTRGNATVRPPPVSSRLARELVHVLHAMLNTASSDTQPRSTEARRIISSFLNSLSLSSLSGAPSLMQMRSHTILTPLYMEDVLYCVHAEEAAKNLGTGGADPATVVRGMTDLLNAPSGDGESQGDQQGSIALLPYLRSVYTSDWDNFCERIARLALAAAAKAASGDSTVLPPWIKPERIRSHLKRGFRRITDQDFREGGLLSPWALELQLWASFRAQVLARTARGMVCCERALRLLAQLEHPRPQGMREELYQAWLQKLSDNKFTYLVAAQAYGKQRDSSDFKERWQAHCVEVLLAKYTAMKVAYLDASRTPGTGGASVLIRAARDGSGTVEEMYRVRLPYNPYNPGRGIVVGEGKPENQNHASIFVFGEALQTIDMNQDGCLAEALKTRNLLAMLSPPDVKPRKDVWCGAESSGSGDNAPRAVDALRALRKARTSGPPPTVICGHKEWVFSHKAGALGAFAASTEYAFATTIQGDMARGNVRLHYGHPDVFDKLHCMTRGGLSKATRGLHVSEDVLGGLNHTLRGGRIAYTEAVSCGKGRDMGFNSILSFETKISCGNGEVLLTRDMARLAPRMDLWRLLHFYHSGLGYFITARFLILGIYCQALALTVVSLAGHNLVNTNIQLAIQIGLVSSLPYVGQLIFETGLFNALIVMVQQLIAGVVAFSIFRMQTTAYYFTNDVLYGGASYIQTGRGFSYRPSSFVQLYASYARSHIYLGFELGLLAVIIAICGTAGSAYGALTWGIWLVAASLMVAPIWFNPLAFNTDNVRKDWRQWRQWLKGERDPEVQASWSTWNRRQLSKIRDDAKQQKGHWKVALAGMVCSSAPHLIQAFVAATRLTADTSIYLLLTMTLWVTVWLLLWMRTVLLDTAKLKAWARMRSLLAIATVALPVAFVVVVTKLYTDGSDHLFLTLYVHLMTLLSIHGAATHLCSGVSALGGLVDDGYWILDALTGTLLLAVVAILSIGGFLEKLQAVLLFNRNFARSVKDSKTSRLFSAWRPTGASGPQETVASDDKLSQELQSAANQVGEQQAAAAVSTRNSALTRLTATLKLKTLLRGNHAGSAGPSSPKNLSRGGSGPAPPAPVPSATQMALLPGQVNAPPFINSPLSSIAATMRASLRGGSGRSGVPTSTTTTTMEPSRLATRTSLSQDLPRPRWESTTGTSSKNYSDAHP